MELANITDSHENIEKVSVLLKLMSNPIRLKILCVLSKGGMHVQDIVAFVGTTQSNVSQHLLRLREQGILCVNKKANRVYYSISDERMLSLLEHMRDIFCDDINNIAQN